MSQDKNTRDTTDNQESQIESQSAVSETTSISENILDDKGRRTFLKRAALGGGVCYRLQRGLAVAADR